MSVERRGDNNYSTVQRRGEKKTFLPSRDWTSQPKPETAASESSVRADTRIYPPSKARIHQFAFKDFEKRVEEKIAALEMNPALRQAYLKKVNGWITKASIAFLFLFMFPPFMIIAITLVIIHELIFFMMPKDVKRKRVEKIQGAVEELVVALKLKRKYK